VRLAGAIVANDHQSFVVPGRGKLQLGDDQADQNVGHAVRDDVGANQVRGLALVIGFPQLDDGLDGIELDQVFVFHTSVSYDGRATMTASGRS